jgi:broad specificity phosphatase PhoE
MFVRHGQATHNVTRAYWDPRERDAALTAEGVRQAWDLRVDRLGERADVICCSPLQRCRQTLGLLLGVGGSSTFGATRAQVLLDDRLMEPQGSAIVNRRAEWQDLRDSVPTGWDLERVGLTNPYDQWVEGGTVGEDGHGHFDARVRAWTEEMCRRYPGRRLLVVTHHDWIASWFRQFSGGRRVSVANGRMIEGTLG